MIKITLEYQSLEEAQDALTLLSGGYTGSPVVQHRNGSSLAPGADGGTAKENSTVIESTDEAAQDDPPAKTTKKKSAEKKTRKTTKPETQDDAPAADAPTKENVRDKLAAVGDKIDFGAVREIVQRFGANGLKELDESQYADVIKACKAKLAE